MKSKNIAITVLLYITGTIQASEIIIRHAKPEDTSTILALNDEVCKEFFMPTFIEGYPEFNKNPQLANNVCDEWNKCFYQIVNILQ